MTIEQLAEREFPHKDAYGYVIIDEYERAAFIRGAKLAVEFWDWWENHDEAYASVRDAFELFLTSKLKGDEKA